MQALTFSHAGADTAKGWSMPPRVSAWLEEMLADGTTLHLFGGLAAFGVRIDIDPVVEPDVIANAWLPPFKRDSFDYVLLDPPFEQISIRWYCELVVRAAWIARRAVLWWNTKWFDPLRPLVLEDAYLVSLGNYYQVRCLEKFGVREPKRLPSRFFGEGPAVKYNWPLAGQLNLGLRGNE